MGLRPIWVLFIVIFLPFVMANSEEQVVKQALVSFMEKLSPGNVHKDPKWGWNLSSDPCIGNWHGVSCYSDNKSVKSVTLEGSSLRGILDAGSLCKAKSLQILSLRNNTLQGLVTEDIGTCKSLTHLFLSGNNFSGDLPISIAKLGNLKRLDISSNFFTGELPNMVHISGLISFLADDNNFSGEIPDFDFSNLDKFNVSNNNLQGLIPDVGGKFQADSFFGNPGLCGKPLPNACPPQPPPPPPPPSPPPNENKDTRSFSDGLSIYSGYVILFIFVLLFFVFKLARKFKPKEEALDHAEKKEMAKETSGDHKPSETSNEAENAFGTRSEYSLASLESGMTASALVISNPALKDLRFEDMLGAPAELIGRGKHGSLYKVMLDNGVVLAVKRINNDGGISKQDFERRMDKICQVKHPHVLPPVAYYRSQQEKLLAYEYMQNGSLFKILYGFQSSHSFDWGSRLKAAANIAEALAYMHEELRESGIAHGSLKSSNILFDKNMVPCISEYGLVVIENLQDQSVNSHARSLRNRNVTAAHEHSTFKADIYGFGVILLELLTGKVVKNDGFNLAKWVNTVVREEWTVEVLDKTLISQGASEERMVNLLQVAIRCIGPSPNDRPSMSQVAVMIITLREEEEKSISFDP